MAKKNKSVFTFPQTNKTQVSSQPTYRSTLTNAPQPISTNAPQPISTNAPQPISTNAPQQQTAIKNSYNKIVDQGEPNISKFTGMLPSTSQFTEQPGANGFYGSMSGLEGASMRLANAASQRTMAEAGYGSGLKKSETAQEYGLKGSLMGQEYGLKGGLTEKEYGLRDISTAKEYGLKDISTAKEYGLKGTQTAQIGGYSNLEEYQKGVEKQRKDDERRARGYSASGNLLPQYYQGR